MAGSKDSTSQKKILLVEEQRAVLHNIIPILQQFGYHVVGSAKDGNDAIELTGKLDVDLILMGIDIPGLLNGIDTARIIHSNKSIPIIYLTSSADSEIINRARDTEPFGYLISPVSLADLQSGIETALEREARERKVRDSEERFRLAAEASGNLIYDYDISTGLNDITEQRIIENEKKRLEEQLRQSQKIESIGRLAGGVAHDFNNLLTAITGNISLALMDISPASRITEFLQDAMRAADSAASFVRQLLAFSSRQVIEPKIVSPNELIGKLQKMIKRLIGEDIIFSTSLEENVGSIKIDPAQFEQIIINLTANARDAMPNGGNLIIETRRINLDSATAATYFNTKPGSYILISVSDTGCGMSDEIKSHIYEPFYSTKPREKGTGLLKTVFKD